MFYKVIDEDGGYVSVDNDPKNLLEANWAETPEGLNVGWTELENVEAAKAFFNLRKIGE